MIILNVAVGEWCFKNILMLLKSELKGERKKLRKAGSIRGGDSVGEVQGQLPSTASLLPSVLLFLNTPPSGGAIHTLLGIGLIHPVGVRMENLGNQYLLDPSLHF